MVCTVDTYLFTFNQDWDVLIVCDNIINYKHY